MSKYAVITEDEVKDYGFRHRNPKNDSVYFYVGDERLGQIFKDGKGDYTARYNGEKPLRGLRMVRGFRSRHHACEYLIRCAGYWE